MSHRSEMIELPGNIVLERNLRIPLSDGVHLAADLYRPAEVGEYPTLLIYQPYHKDDIIGPLYFRANQFFAAHGYACLLIDMRGTGSSSGISPPCFDPQEGTDGVEAVEWAARQPWSSGSVGMWGISYPAINAIRVATLQPAPLKAIAPIMGTADPYSDWLYPGGAKDCLGTHAGWGTSMVARQMLPPSFWDKQGDWERIWQQRLDQLQPWIVTWYQHLEDETFWKRMAVRYEDVKVPAFYINGWRDIFPDSMIQGYKRTAGPRKLWAGPWLHMLPDVSTHFPVEYLSVLKDWWDSWLSTGDADRDSSPDVTYFVQGSNVWRHANDWPPAGTQQRTLRLDADYSLTEAEEVTTGVLAYSTDPTVGTAAGLLDPMGLGVGLPADQREDEARSLCFTGVPSTDRVEITGRAFLQVCLSAEASEAQEANLVAKLSEVKPNGESHLITSAVRRVVLDQAPTPVQLAFTETSYEVDAGSTLRVAIALGDFPRVWPTPDNVSIAAHLEPGRTNTLTIPVTPTSDDGDKAFSPISTESAANRPPMAHYGRPKWSVTRDQATGEASIDIGLDSSLHSVDGRTQMQIQHRGRARVRPDLPEAASVSAKRTISLVTPTANEIEVAAQTLLTARTARVHGRVTIDGRLVFERIWSSPSYIGTDEDTRGGRQ